MKENLNSKCIWKGVTENHGFSIAEDGIRKCVECSGYKVTCKDYKSRAAYKREQLNEIRNGWNRGNRNWRA